MTFLSIIIPAHQEAERLIFSLKEIDSYLSKQAYSAEVIVVENGSSDCTAEITQNFIKDHSYVRLIREPKQ